MHGLKSTVEYILVVDMYMAYTTENCFSFVFLNIIPYGEIPSLTDKERPGLSPTFHFI